MLIAIVVLTTLLGILLTSGKKKRMQFYSELYEFNEQLILNLKFTRSPIDKIAQQFNFIPDVMQGKKSFEGKDAEFIEDYFANLGKTDALSQIDYLNGRKPALSKLKDESAESYKKYGSLYVKIFFMVGVLFAILLA